MLRGGEIIQYLFDVRVCQFFEGFGLKENLIPDHEVCVIVVRQDYSLVRDLVVLLAYKGNSSATQLND